MVEHFFKFEDNTGTIRILPSSYPDLYMVIVEPFNSPAKVPTEMRLSDIRDRWGDIVAKGVDFNL